MNSTIFVRLIVPAALVISPAAASAQSRPMTIAENNVAASTIVPAPTATTTAVAPEATAQPAEKKICKLLPSSYSRMNVRSCLTAKQWKQVEASQQDQ
jgi:hypothetical protein